MKGQIKSDLNKDEHNYYDVGVLNLKSIQKPGEYHQVTAQAFQPKKVIAKGRSIKVSSLENQAYTYTNIHVQT